MENPYKNMSNEELKVIYDDIIFSEKVPQRVESLVPYGNDLKNLIGGNFTLREGIDWARNDFFEEIANRFFNQ